MDQAALRRKDTTKGPALRVLSLDGGGVRGYSMLILLQELMYKTFNEAEGKAPRRDQIPKPCEYFDLIAGTGTGGLIAIMLGRLRLDLETCKEVYTRMTRKVFETDKTIAGIPYRSTLFKASKLEEAIMECVKEHTISEEEGNDGSRSTTSIPEGRKSLNEGRRLSFSSSINSGRPSSSGKSSYTTATSHAPSPFRRGNPNASLYDSRENRTKTAVAAVYKGTPKSGNSILLRSYDSRREPPPEFNCTIWQAGRATSATGLAFKPIQIGQSMFIDEGAGNYNPAVQIIDEAVVNEWPGRDLGVFISIGTGKRPSGSTKQQDWWEGFLGGMGGSFAEAKTRLIAKIEGCEDTHQYVLKEHLSARGINPENYYRLNVEVGVGEFGMNEWNRLADISTNTRKYLARPEVKQIIESAAMKLARIERASRRQPPTTGYDYKDVESGYPTSNPMAVELPAGEVSSTYSNPQRFSHADSSVRFSQTDSGRYSYADSNRFSHASNIGPPLPPRSEVSELSPNDIPQDGLYRRSWETNRRQDDPRLSDSSLMPQPQRQSQAGPSQSEAPPLPPKTPLTVDTNDIHPAFRNQAQPPRMPTFGARGDYPLPYPDDEDDDDGPPPPVNMARKPEYINR